MKQRGLTLVDVIVILAVVVLAAIMVLPSLVHSPNKAPRAQCTNRLKQLGLAYLTWAEDHGGKFPMTVLTNRDGSLEMAAGTNAFRAFQVMSNEVNDPRILICPLDNRSPPNNNDFSKLSNINISYFVGLDTDETYPAMLLSGDRNLETNGVAVDTGLLVLTQTNGLGFTKNIHNRQGNIVLADGSVQRVSNPFFPTIVSRAGTNVTRIAVP